MLSPLVECVPNFSEARNLEVIEKIKNAIQNVSGIQVLDQHSDPDHNRTVITFVGPPASVEKAAFNAIKTAGELINLDNHTGEHPRIGATDVVPFIPIRDIDMQECIAMANRVGEKVGKELNIPVYLYEEAASLPERKNLANIRRGEYEGLKDEIISNPKKKPDFGPNQLGTAGATVIGARQFLIAYNVYLNTIDLQIAQKIGKAIRHSSGGLRFVKALGMLVEGKAQVSMNLTNFRKTPIARVVEMIRTEAARYGVSITHSELVGMIPQDAMIDAAVWYLQLDDFKPEMILENKLVNGNQESPEDSPKEISYPFLDALANKEPTPGGGSAAAYSGAASAALTSMVAQLTIGKKKYAEVEKEMQAIFKEAELLRRELTMAIQKDADAFTRLMDSYRLPKSTQQDTDYRKDQIIEKTFKAAEVPLETIKLVLKTLELILLVAEKGNKNAITDAGSAAALAKAAITSAAYNVKINLMDFPDQNRAAKLLDTLSSLLVEANTHEVKLESILKERGGISLS
ncbi:MAG: glutamate formimidoyltransferase [Anaerolineaceae bacterium]|nr:glutamate formimidoyltransferase [Anaerolineaceae bacterium]